MTQFNYREGRLFAEDVDIVEIASNIGTPFYCYSKAAITEQYEAMANALDHFSARICYAVKANSNLAIIKTLSDLGAGADVVSEGEARRALASGIPAANIVFSGVGKTREEMRFAILAGVGQFNVESIGELEILNDVAIEIGKTAIVALRVNPDVDAETHYKISTGRREDKFGINIELAPSVYEKALSLPGLKLVGLAVHIGSQLTSLKPFRKAFERVADMVNILRKAGYNLSRLDLGGGLGITYDGEQPPGPVDYANMVAETVGSLDVELTFEPGRFLVGNAGILVTSVIQVKETDNKRFVVVDAAMNDLIRPALYNAVHHVQTAINLKGNDTFITELVGPICETGDVLARNVQLPALVENDLLYLKSAGAYGAVMASSYNSRLLVPEIMVNRNDFNVIRARPSYDDLLGLDQIPKWINQ
ncbi:MAG: diaminopimelate decarboxylase [Pseudomonadota bacterium]|nr:diaminopimelate decarboxylase [Pseudomonadota bacterium]